MKLKCVGGPNDGEYGITQDHKPRVGEHVKMSERSSIRIFDTGRTVMYIVDRDNDGLFLRLA